MGCQFPIIKRYSNHTILCIDHYTFWPCFFFLSWFVSSNKARIISMHEKGTPDILLVLEIHTCSYVMSTIVYLYVGSSMSSCI